MKRVLLPLLQSTPTNWNLSNIRNVISNTVLTQELEPVNNYFKVIFLKEPLTFKIERIQKTCHQRSCERYYEGQSDKNQILCCFS